MAEFCIGSGAESSTRVHLEVVVCLEEVALGCLGGMTEGQLQQKITEVTTKTPKDNTNKTMKATK